MLKYMQLRAYQKTDQGDNHSVDRMARIGTCFIEHEIKFLENLIEKFSTKMLKNKKLSSFDFASFDPGFYCFVHCLG